MPALEGTRVLDMSNGIAGQYAAKLLGDYGADVVRIDPPGTNAHRDPIGEALNTSKRSATVDIAQPEGGALLRDLVLDFDVLIEDLPPGEMDRLGIGYETLAAIKPRLVHVSVTAFGADGPDAGREANDAELLALAGLQPGQSGLGERSAALRAGIHAFTAAALGMLTSHVMETGHQVEVATIEALAATLPEGARLAGDDEPARGELPPPFALSGDTGKAEPAPPVGRHTDEILLAELGLDPDAIHDLRRGGIV